MIGSESDQIWYLDTSVVLRIALGHSPTATDWFNQGCDRGDAFVTSRLTALESLRVLRREGLDLGLADEVLDLTTLLAVDDALLAEAGAIQPHVKTLDALHLASAARVGVHAVTVVTHDATMIRSARELGFAVHDPVVE
ncbi:MAG: type II toxin-antitoxin system VapC family toxin [Micropruina sp.]|uniref:type II toxin-antitoxin system VapC family toxin n=1 Tax=Micropruina sp. TaxID=2737536 RepID=UPI0039E58BDF